MGWTGLPLQPGDNWTDPDFIRQFDGALAERFNAIGGTYTPFFVESGTPLQYPGIGLGVPNTAYRYFQFQLHRMFQHPTIYRWIAPGSVDYSPTDVPTATYIFSLADLRSYLGLPGESFTRKFPRRISSLAQSGSIGQRAWGTGTLANGMVYEHNGTSWAIAADQSIGPDMLTDYGVGLAGDYIGHWVWNELYQMLNGLRAIFHVSRGGAGAIEATDLTRRRKGGQAEDPNLTPFNPSRVQEAYNNMTDADCEELAPASLPKMYSWWYATGWSNYVAAQEVETAVLTRHPTVVADGRCQVRVKAEKISHVTVEKAFELWDDQGTGWIEGEYIKIYDGKLSEMNLRVPDYDACTPVPNWHEPTEFTPTSQSPVYGFFVDQLAYEMDWDFEYLD